MKTVKPVKQISVFRILVNQLILWPIGHIILALCTGGISLLFSWLGQLLDLCISLRQRGKFAEQQRQEMLEAIRGGHNSNQ